MEWIYEVVLYLSLLGIIGWIRKQYRIEEQKKDCERELESKIAELSASYYKFHNIEDALYEVKMKEAKRKSLQKKRRINHAGKLEKSSYEILLHKLCGMVQQIGDRRKEGISVFQRNLFAIRDEIQGNILLEQNRHYLFLGLRSLCVIPFFVNPLLSWWSLHISEQMNQYYRGRFEFITITITYVITLLVYFLVSWLQNPELMKKCTYRFEKRCFYNKKISRWMDRIIQRRYSYFLKKNEALKKLQGFGNVKEFELRKRVFCLIGISVGILFFGLFRMVGKADVEKQLVFPRMYTLSLEQDETEELNEHIRAQFRQLITNQRSLEEIQQDYQDYPKEIQDTVTLLLQQGYRQWKGTGITVWYVCVLIILGMLGYFLPEVILWMEQWHVAEKKMLEVQRLQIVIFVQIQDPESTIEQVLDAMEEHASLFRSAVEEAVDHFSMNRRQSIEKLVEQTAYEPMERICEKLFLCEEIGVEEAFAGIEEERKYLLQKNMQERNAQLRERAALARAVAYLPFLGVLVLKLIVPFVAEGLSQLHLYGQGIGNYF